MKKPKQLKAKVNPVRPAIRPQRQKIFWSDRTLDEGFKTRDLVVTNTSEKTVDPVVVKAKRKKNLVINDESPDRSNKQRVYPDYVQTNSNELDALEALNLIPGQLYTTDALTKAKSRHVLPVLQDVHWTLGRWSGDVVIVPANSIIFYIGSSPFEEKRCLADVDQIIIMNRHIFLFGDLRFILNSFSCLRKISDV